MKEDGLLVKNEFILLSFYTIDIYSIIFGNTINVT